MANAFIVITLVLTLVVALAVIAWDALKQKPTDTLAERKRKISHRGFKSRAGIRS